MLPFERLAQWAGKLNIPLKVLGGLVDHADALAELLTGPGRGLCGTQGSVTGRPGWLIVPGGQYHVMISTVSRPARTAGSSSASSRDRSSEPVR